MAKQIPTENQSPNFLAAKPKVKKTDRKVTALIGVVIAAMALIFILTLTRDKQKTEKTAEAPKVDLSDEKPLMAKTGEGLGVALTPETTPVAPLAPSSKGGKVDSRGSQIMVIGPPEVDRDEESLRREREEIRRRKLEVRQQAITSGIMVKRGGESNSSAAQASAPEAGKAAADNAYTPAGQDSYDPAADRDKEAFFERADISQWVSPYTREAGRPFEIKTGTVVPALMVTGVNSDLPGNLIAQVSQNVYDTASGNSLLIPQGSKIYGVYDSRVIYGQRRVLIAWNRVIFPDGSSVTLGAMPGADISGYAGFEDKVDNHYLRIFGSAVLMSLITGGASYAVDKMDNSSDDDTPSMQNEMASALAAQIGQATMKMLEKNLSIKPTLEIRPGYQFNIVVTKDVVFRGPYDAQ